MKEAYDEAYKLFNLERELKLVKKETLTTLVMVRGKEKGSWVPIGLGEWSTKIIRDLLDKNPYEDSHGTGTQDNGEDHFFPSKAFLES